MAGQSIDAGTPAPVKAHRRFWRWCLGVITALILLGFSAPFFTLVKGRGRILAALRAALGRSVQAQSVHLVLIPWPGFELDQLQVADDPAYGYQPIIRAAEATATLRLAALWKGRFEFSSIELDRPNLNLARSRQRRWNLAALVDRSARRIPALEQRAISRRKPARLPFPFLKIRQGRINFNLNGVETPFYLRRVHADIGQSGGRWTFSMRFVPARTDLNLHDLGQVMVQGWWQTGPAPWRRLPFLLQAQLEQAYIAPFSAFWLGHEGSLDGLFNAQLRLSGNGKDFQIQGQIAGQSLHRLDLLPTNWRPRIQFQAAYSTRQDRFTLQRASLDSIPGLQLSGRIAHVLHHARPRWNLRLRKVKLADLLPLAAICKSGLSSFHPQGWLEGDLDWRGRAPRWQKNSSLRLYHAAWSSPDMKIQAARAVTWQIDSQVWRLPQTAVKIALPGHAPASARISAWLTPRIYQIHLATSAMASRQWRALQRLLTLPPAWLGGLRGTVRAQAWLRAGWRNFRHPQWSGRVRLRSAYWLWPGRIRPIPLQQAEVRYQSQTAWMRLQGRLQKLNWRVFLRKNPDGSLRLRLDSTHGDWTQWASLLGLRRRHGLQSWLRGSGFEPPRFSPHRITASLNLGDLHWRHARLRVRATVEMQPDRWNWTSAQVFVQQGVLTGTGIWNRSGCEWQAQAASLPLRPLWPGFGLSGYWSGPLRADLRGCDPALGWNMSGMAVIRAPQLPHWSLQSGQSLLPIPPTRLITAAFNASPGRIQLHQLQWLPILTRAENERPTPEWPRGIWRGTGGWSRTNGWSLHFISPAGRSLTLTHAPVTPAGVRTPLSRPASAAKNSIPKS